MDNESKPKSPNDPGLVEAAFLRRRAEEVRRALEQERERQNREKLEQLEERHRQAFREFLDRRFTDADRMRFKEMTRAAVRAGEFEVQILRFPSNYLNDGGRAINNNDRNWPIYLTGFAKSIYDAHETMTKPLGYRLTARILSYPDGHIGDIGLFLSW